MTGLLGWPGSIVSLFLYLIKMTFSKSDSYFLIYFLTYGFFCVFIPTKGIPGLPGDLGDQGEKGEEVN